MAEKERRKGKLFIRLTALIGLSIIALNMIESVSLVEGYIRKQLRKSNEERYMQMTELYADAITQKLDEYFGLLSYYINADVVQTGDTKKIVDWMYSHKQYRSDVFDYIGFADAAADFYSDEGPVTNVSERDYYQAIMKKGSDYFIDNPVTSKSTGKTIIHVCKAAKANGRTIGLFSGVIQIEHISSLVSGINLGNTGTVLLMAGNGDLITTVGDMNIINADSKDKAAQAKIEQMKKDIGLKKGGVYWVQNADKKIGEILGVYAPVDKTMWSLSIALKGSVVNALANTVAKIMTVCAFILASIIILVTAASLYFALKPLGIVEKNILDIATGNADLRKRIDLNINNEIGRVVEGFNLFSHKLQEIIRTMKASKDELVYAGTTLKSSIDETTSSITEISANIDSIGSSINVQTSSVTETAGAVNEIASNIESLNKMIEAQSSAVVQASAAVEQMIGNINSVNKSVQHMGKEFKELQESATLGVKLQDDVNNKIIVIESESKALKDANAVISSIAAQTNLLAMNAAIEAAHAGESGKGFSVVADEIRKLSENSSAQSKTIGEQLNKITTGIEEIVGASQNARKALSQISTGISSTDNLVQEITNSMQEQEEGSKQISDALHSMNDSSLEVKTASIEMAEGNKAILAEIKNLQDTSYSMKSGMDEMAVGAKHINETSANLSTISEQMECSIKMMGTQVDQFEV